MDPESAPAHQIKRGPRRAALTITAAVALGGGLLAAGQMAQAGTNNHGVYRQANLVSDIPGVARITDPNLVNPWGMSEFPNGPLWVSDNGADVATLYTGGAHNAPLLPAPLVVSIPDGAPTGQVFNPTSGFTVHSGGASAPALFLFASENGDITGWAPNVPAQPPGQFSDQAQVGFSDPNAVYKGLAINSAGPHPELFATNFRAGRIDVFDSSFNLVPHLGKFTDPNLSAGYAPFGIANIGGKLYVSCALQDAAKHDDVSGPGHGFVDVYSLGGTLLQRLISGGALNSPWGMVQATGDFGTFGGDLLVGNFGDGLIHAYDPATGQLKGTLTNQDGNPIQINGLWGLIFGDKAAGNPNTLFFAAGIGDESHGLLGTIRPAQ